MKSMRVLIDTNIILDWLMSREPFQENAIYIMKEINSYGLLYERYRSSLKF